MSKQQVKLQNWLFKKGEQAQLTWISSPFVQDKKVMIHVYFKANGSTKRLLVDWGTLPALAIQHLYMDGDISKSIAPTGTEEVEITISPKSVTYSEREWNIFGTADKDISRSFIVSYKNKKYILPLIEAVRSILAPNRFLLYRLFETNSFPQYFIEQYSANNLHLDFTSLYDQKYTKGNFLYQLAWLLSKPDLRHVFENTAYTFMNNGTLKFDWTLTQPITIKAIVKPSTIGCTVLRITAVKNKIIPYDDIIIDHPAFAQSQKTSEAKKYTIHSKNSNNTAQDELTLDEQAEGTTVHFDLVEMDNQVHEYVKLPKVTKICRSSNKQRTHEDENTKKYFYDDQGRRSTSDVGGNKVAKGLESQSLYDIQTHGELGEFIRVLKALESYPEVQSINVIQGSLKEFSHTKRFVYLNDGVTDRKYVIAEVKLFSNKEISLIEIEREARSVSTLIYFLDNQKNRIYAYKQALQELINTNGNWNKDQLKSNNINFLTLRHGKKEYCHRAKKILTKII
ncbi:Tn7-like element transposition protein TnsE [Bacillus badius]|uniref:TnsE C-terminal domain-containing protein n=1 Tax=Bacillus badius TaxID=1455 RepID=A0ABR5AP59_BACBA|nr:Tn7-like element transposition protein TnsE [Bacillus badius]KIL74126.1 hypothetical protein SD77_2982 [Bacillus badius]MED4717337.1 Tn7-like element transposition protein TnsE [Bacillus badius]